MPASVTPTIVTGPAYKGTHWGAACEDCGWVAPNKFGGPNAEARAQAVADEHECEETK
jgi:hypothetical protein